MLPYAAAVAYAAQMLGTGARAALASVSSAVLPCRPLSHLRGLSLQGDLDFGAEQEDIVRNFELSDSEGEEEEEEEGEDS